MGWNNVSFSEIGSSCPSQNIQPAGAKLPANMRISPTYGCATVKPPLGLRWVDALQCDAEVQSEIRLHVQVRLAASYGRHSGRERHEVCWGAIGVGDAAEIGVGGRGVRLGGRGGGIHPMGVGRHFRR